MFILINGMVAKKKPKYNLIRNQFKIKYFHTLIKKLGNLLREDKAKKVLKPKHLLGYIAFSNKKKSKTKTFIRSFDSGILYIQCYDTILIS